MLYINDNINEYIFIYDFNGKSLHHPIAKDNIGKNLLGITDINGKKVIKRTHRRIKKT